MSESSYKRLDRACELRGIRLEFCLDRVERLAGHHASQAAQTTGYYLRNALHLFRSELAAM